MQVSLVRGLAVLLFAGATSLVRCADVKAPIQIEFWHVGDDVQSQRLAVAVETAFRRSPDFRLTVMGKGRTLVVMIMRNVQWEMVGKRPKAVYTVRFSWLDDNASRTPDVEQRLALATDIDTQRGSCWASELAKCATQIVSDAKIAANKMPQ